VSERLLQIADQGRVRLLTLDRPGALNSFNEALYDATTEAFLDAARDRKIAVAVITGTGRAFSTGTDVGEMAARATGGEFVEGRHGFPGLINALREFPKPLLCAVNGMALGIGATMFGYADLVFMSTEASVKLPFTSLAVAPEAGSSLTFPRLLGRQHATWALLSSEWLSADECLRMGLVWKLCAPDELLDETLAHARILAGKPISSLIETKRTIVAGLLDGLDDAIERENDAYRRLLGAPANLEAFAAFAEKREPDFESIDE
jgi:enoyl-CoA hydratase/carnithine racemase